MQLESAWDRPIALEYFWFLYPAIPPYSLSLPGISILPSSLAKPLRLGQSGEGFTPWLSGVAPSRVPPRRALARTILILFFLARDPELDPSCISVYYDVRTVADRIPHPVSALRRPRSVTPAMRSTRVRLCLADARPRRTRRWTTASAGPLLRRTRRSATTADTQVYHYSGHVDPPSRRTRRCTTAA